MEVLWPRVPRLVGDDEVLVSYGGGVPGPSHDLNWELEKETFGRIFSAESQVCKIKVLQGVVDPREVANVVYVTLAVRCGGDHVGVARPKNEHVGADPCFTILRKNSQKI